MNPTQPAPASNHANRPTASNTDAILRAVLDMPSQAPEANSQGVQRAAQPWETTLPAEWHAEAAEWSNLADSLRSALRMGPGGLTDKQRNTILDQAARLNRPILPSAPLPRPQAASSAGFHPWKITAAAAAIAAGLLAIGQHIPSTAGIQPEKWATSQSPKAQKRPASEGFSVRILPGESLFSRYNQPNHQQLVGNTPATDFQQDWSAIGMGGGFQPAAMANVTEVIPTLPTPIPALPDLLAAGPASGHNAAGGLLKHFCFNYPEPTAGDALGITVQSGPCPWRASNLLVHIGIRASGTTDPKNTQIAARDVRLRVEFNPARVSAFRLIGHAPVPTGHTTYTTNNTKSGGELACGQLVTAIYEIVPAGYPTPKNSDGTSWTSATPATTDNDGILTASVQFRAPNAPTQTERQFVLNDTSVPHGLAANDFQFSAAVAACGLLLDQAPGLQSFAMQDALDLARSSIGQDPDGKRSEFISLLQNTLKK